MEDKYRSLLHINQQLDAQLLKLQAQNDCLQQKLVSSQIRASRHRVNRGESPQAGAATSPKSSPSRSESESKQEPLETKEMIGEESSDVSPRNERIGEESLDVLAERHDSRRVSQMSKDSGRGSMLMSSQFSKSGSIAESLTSTVKRDSPAPISGSSPPSALKPLQASPESKPTLPKETEEVTPDKKKASSPEQEADAVSQSSDGPHGLADSRAMMYTDSEDNGSQSSNSNFTSDSGIFSKVEHAN